MAHRLQVQFTIPDTRALVRKKKLHALGYSKIDTVHLVDIYTIDKDLSPQELEKVGSALSNPVIQSFSFTQSLPPQSFDWALEIGFLPGVTDNIAHTAKESIEDLLTVRFKPPEAVYTSQITFIQGKLNNKEAQAIGESLANTLIQRIHIKSASQFVQDGGMDTIVPKVHLVEKIKVDEVNLNISDENLEKLGKLGIENSNGMRRGPLALSLRYLHAIRDYFARHKRNPTDIELETLAQTWSEHCKHTIFSASLDDIKAGIYQQYIKKATEIIRKRNGKRDFCVSVFKDNSGAIVFDDQWLITHKVETHNSPSALDPYGGAITGIVGVNRDTIGFGKAAKPIINQYGYCFGEPTDEQPLYRGKDKTNTMLPPKRIMLGVVEGVKDGGNCSGIPTPQGFCFFEKRYKGKPLVFVGTAGLIPKYINHQPSWKKEAQPGDLIVMIGGRVGQDGIHGATFSSEALTLGSPATAVQIGDPITQKKFSDAIIKEARQLDLYHSITDNGAGGLSSSVGEMAKETNGCLVFLDRVPVKYPGLAPWQIWVSESQERMTVAVPPNKLDQFTTLMQRRGVESTVIGEFTNSGSCIVKFHNQTVVDIEMEFLHEGTPQKSLQSKQVKKTYPEPTFPCPNNVTDTLLNLLSRFNICSFSFISHQYDHEVQGSSVLKPLQGKGAVNAQATVTRPLLTSKKGIVLTQGITPTYSDIDTYHMAACAIDSAVRAAIAAGAPLNYLALLDNFCWCDPENSEQLHKLKEAARACYDYATVYGTPFISGKDSMYNDFKGYDEKNNCIKISIPPTLLITAIGVLNDVSKTVSLESKMPGDLIYVLGTTNNELGASEYFAYASAQSKENNKLIGNTIPTVNAHSAKALYQALSQAIEKELVASAESITRGGLGIALAKVAIGGQLGMHIDLSPLPRTNSLTRTDYILFSESQSRFIVTINPKNKKRFENIMHKQCLACIGTVTDDHQFTIKDIRHQPIVATTIKKITHAYKKTFRDW